jgi:hypothetical protein
MAECDVLDKQNVDTYCCENFTSRVFSSYCTLLVFISTFTPFQYQDLMLATHTLYYCVTAHDKLSYNGSKCETKRDLVQQVPGS